MTGRVAKDFFNTPVVFDDGVEKLPFRVTLSPMEGVMTSSFCRAANNLGLVPYWTTPFFRVSALSVPSKRIILKSLEPYGNIENVAVQLLGHDEEGFAESARRFAEAGVRAIDLNFACPSRQVVNHGSGAACLAKPSKIYGLVKAVRDAVPDLRVSVKLRTGIKSPDESFDVGQAVCDSGAHLVTLHYRTASEQYVRIPDGWKRIKAFCERFSSRIKIFGNGDVGNYSDAVKMVEETSCDGVAVARAIMYNPFIINKIRCNDNTPSSGLERMKFLKEVYSCSMNAEGGFNKDAFIECVKMTCGRGELMKNVIALDAEGIGRLFD